MTVFLNVESVRFKKQQKCMSILDRGSKLISKLNRAETFKMCIPFFNYTYLCETSFLTMCAIKITIKINWKYNNYENSINKFY